MDEKKITTEYKVIEAFGAEKFSNLLNQHTEDGWIMWSQPDAVYHPSGTKHFVTLSKNKES